jgi:2-polyprenyl-3-methyl-5-hydroxy-6-metoxy-1,4-benzoquinol methylase
LDGLGELRGMRALDVGCGAGAITRRLTERGLHAVGIDINAAAIARLQRDVPHARFYERDSAAPAGFQLGDEPAFDLVVCQLVISIVGDARDRAQLLRNTHDALRAAGQLFISFSGLSDDLNATYAELYAGDVAATHEYGGYFSRDAVGTVLYRTQHFARDQAHGLLQAGGFDEIAIEEQIETSSRRPDQRARFFYASCRRR